MTLSLGQCEGSMMPWKFLKSQTGLLRSAQETCRQGLSSRWCFELAQCLEIGSFYIKIWVSCFYCKSRNLTTLGSNAIEAPVSGSPSNGSCLLELKTLGLWSRLCQWTQPSYIHATIIVERTRLVLVLPGTAACSSNAMVAARLHLQPSSNHSHPSLSPMPSGRFIKCDMNC